MDKKYCPLYEGVISQYDCHEISCGAKNGYIANDGLPPLVPIQDIKKKRQICLNCQGIVASEIKIASSSIHNKSTKTEKKMSEDEIRRRLAGRAAEYLMFMDD